MGEAPAGAAGWTPWSSGGVGMNAVMSASVVAEPDDQEAEDEEEEDEEEEQGDGPDSESEEGEIIM